MLDQALLGPPFSWNLPANVEVFSGDAEKNGLFS